MVTFTPPTESELKGRRLQFLSENKPQALRKLRKSGELEMDLTISAQATKRVAEDLIKAGEFPPQAWYRAECQEVCERETD